MTNEDGRVTFESLPPREYYLRPMMKEYRFNPSSRIINVEEGFTVKVKLLGNRVSFSAYGSVFSLNGKPEEGLFVTAQGQSECSTFVEEATTDENGNFRIRGLQPSVTNGFYLLFVCVYMSNLVYSKLYFSSLKEFIKLEPKVQIRIPEITITLKIRRN